MSKLLFDESPLVVQPTLAKAIGLNETIVLQQINYWMNQKGVGRTIKGVRWIYNTVSEWKDNFPFWSEETIKRTIYNLQDAQLIQTGNYNQSAMDRTKWYTINFETVTLLEALIQQEKELAAETVNDASCQNDTMDVSECYDIPETTSEITNSLSKGAPEKVESVEEIPPRQKALDVLEKAFFQYGGTLNNSFIEKFYLAFEKNPDHPKERLEYALKRLNETRSFWKAIDGYREYDPNPKQTYTARSAPSVKSAAPDPNRGIVTEEKRAALLREHLRLKAENRARANAP